jgi:hypothetical protein
VAIRQLDETKPTNDVIPFIHRIIVPVGNREIFRLSSSSPVTRKFSLKMLSTGILTPLGLGGRQKFQIGSDSG